MTLTGLLTCGLSLTLARRFLVASVAALVVCLVDGFYRSGSAVPGAFVVDMPLYSQVAHDGLLNQAEALAESEINRRFDQDASLTEIVVVVVGSRNGEAIPVLTTRVSRTQWQENPQVSAWTQYYNSQTYALLQRHEERSRSGSATSSRDSAAPSSAAQNRDRTPSDLIDGAYDDGRLGGEDIQRQYLEQLD